MVHSMDRLARNLDDLRSIVQTLTQRGICIEFVKESLKFSREDSPMAILRHLRGFRFAPRIRDLADK